MKTFTGFEYLLIDLANQFGLDKETFENRVKWGMDNLHHLESLVDQADNKPLYIKAMQAVRKALRKEPTGHLVGFDGVCSGVQIMSALTGCYEGAKATGLVDPDVRADAYSTATKVMNEILADQGLSVHIPRADAKQAMMTSFYGSKLTPKTLFGEDTPELTAFYQAMMKIAPGPWELLQSLLDSWQPWAKSHEWQLPDGFEAKVKVMSKVEARVEVDELDHATFTYEFYVNEGQPKGLSNAANLVHSVDALLLREMHRRCNYDPVVVREVENLLTEELHIRESNSQIDMDEHHPISKYVDLWTRTSFCSAVILNFIDEYSVGMLPKELIEDLLDLIHTIDHKPFELVTVHDESI